jgi:hypothetical protein
MIGGMATATSPVSIARLRKLMPNSEIQNPKFKIRI